LVIDHDQFNIVKSKTHRRQWALIKWKWNKKCISAC
jgi:hypothetical protein